LSIQFLLKGKNLSSLSDFLNYTAPPYFSGGFPNPAFYLEVIFADFGQLFILIIETKHLSVKSFTI